jgi:NAD(P)-dependent dehydrogenase (short-subunit alcohol dehydrogenase family)
MNKTTAQIFDLTGQVAIITGGGNGIGASIASRLAGDNRGRAASGGGPHVYRRAPQRQPRNSPGRSGRPVRRRGFRLPAMLHLTTAVQRSPRLRAHQFA